MQSMMILLLKVMVSLMKKHQLLPSSNKNQSRKRMNCNVTLQAIFYTELATHWIGGMQTNTISRDFQQWREICWLFLLPLHLRKGCFQVVDLSCHSTELDLTLQP